jgi:hypothetical protein
MLYLKNYQTLHKNISRWLNTYSQEHTLLVHFSNVLDCRNNQLCRKICKLQVLYFRKLVGSENHTERNARFDRIFL